MDRAVAVLRFGFLVSYLSMIQKYRTQKILPDSLRSRHHLASSGREYLGFQYAVCPKCGVQTLTEYQFCQHPGCGFNVGLYYEPVTLQTIHSSRKEGDINYDNYSPEEVMAGVPHGGHFKDSGFTKESTKNWSEQHAEDVEYAKEVLSE